MILYNTNTLESNLESNMDTKKVVAYTKVNKKIRQMRYHAPLIS